MVTLTAPLPPPAGERPGDRAAVRSADENGVRGRAAV